MKSKSDWRRLCALGLSGLLSASLMTSAMAEEELEWDEAELFFELNDTDGDLGIHALIDGEPWKRVEIEDRRGRTILNIRATGRLRRQGMTQMEWESAEPTFDELTPEAFFERFPEGEYEIEGVTLEGDELQAEIDISHVLAAPVDNVTVNGQDKAEDCDAENLPVVSTPILVDWDEVTESHPEIGTSGEEVEIERYQFFAEREDVKLSVDLPPDVTEFLIPDAFIALGNDWKFEIIARTEEGNNTAIESCFLVN